MRLLFTGFLLLASLFPGLALAQKSKLEHPPLENYLRWGPLRVRPGFYLSNFGYDSNIFASNAVEVGDITGTLAPQVDGLVLIGKRSFLEFIERIEYVAYLEHTDQNYWNQKGSARYTFPFERFGVFGDFEFNSILERPIDEQDNRRRRNETLLGGGFIFELGWRTEIVIKQTLANFEYTDPDLNQDISNQLDRNERRTDFAGSYLLNGRTRALFDAEQRDTKFARPDDRGRIRDSDGWQLRGGLGFGDRGRLTGTLRVGWAKIIPVDPRVPELSEPVGDAELSLKVGGGLRLVLDVVRVPGYSVSQIYYMSESYRLRAIRFFNRFLGVDGGVRYGTLDFPTDAGQLQEARHDVFWTYDAGVRLRLATNSMGRRVEYRLSLQHTDRTSILWSSFSPHRPDRRSPARSRGATRGRGISVMKLVAQTIGIVLALSLLVDLPAAAQEDTDRDAAEPLTLEARPVTTPIPRELVPLLRPGATDTMPLLGRLMVGGLTKGELEIKVAGLLAERFVHDPQVTVFVKEYQSRRVAVSGAVNPPGTYEMLGQKTLLEMLSMAGGLGQEVGKQIIIFRQRPDGGTQRVPIDLEQLVYRADPLLNHVVAPGDIIYVPSIEKIRIYVNGAVNNPNLYEVPRDVPVTVLRAITLAGGTTDRAALKKVQIMRNDPDGTHAVLQVDLKKIKQGKAEDPILQAEDIVLVPEAFF